MSKFFETYKTLRITALAIGAIIMGISAIKANAHTFEFEYIGPGGLGDGCEKELHDREIGKSIERFWEGTANDRDYDNVREAIETGRINCRDVKVTIKRKKKKDQ
jgi:hypothetical protein